MKPSYFLPAFTLAALLFSSCGTKNTETPDEEIATNETFTLSKSQFETSGMQLGKPEKMTFIHKTRANGKISAAPAGMAQISSMIPGKVRQIAVNIGDRVNKGQLLCTIESS